MAAWVNEVDRVIIAITIQVQAVDIFRVEVGGIVGRNESSPLGGVISGVAIIQASVRRCAITSADFTILGVSGGSKPPPYIIHTAFLR